MLMMMRMMIIMMTMVVLLLLSVMVILMMIIVMMVMVLMRKVSATVCDPNSPATISDLYHLICCFPIAHSMIIMFRSDFKLRDKSPNGHLVDD